jgi:hypothetical protein
VTTTGLVVIADEKIAAPTAHEITLSHPSMNAVTRALGVVVECLRARAFASHALSLAMNSLWPSFG